MCSGCYLKENESPKVEEIQVEGPKSGEVRVRMLFASICHTDVLGCRGFPTPLFPRVLGHEGVGMSIQGQQLYHFLSCSTWSQYTVVDVNYLVKIHPNIPLPHASFLSCGFTTGFGAVWKEAKVHKGSTVAVVGLGAVGLGVIEGARVHGASRIIGIDINQSKQAVGEAFGMTDFINPKLESDKSISEMVKLLTGGCGVDYSFECTGVAQLVNEALETTKVGIGKLMMLGAATDKSVEIDFVTLLSCRTLKYAVFGGVKVQSDLPLVIHKCINKEIQNLDRLSTHQVALEDISTAFQLLKEPQCVKALQVFSRAPKVSRLNVHKQQDIRDSARQAHIRAKPEGIPTTLSDD
ncbi:UNVERIFIED_CONTAM: CYP enzymes assisting alcohol dehydrogenase [Sesamum angustifolium]|uniref:CYP enzymes assisting alcohol dehydrogenase n=1 Tax=Sesamum angustifolium TaxID=2727405 RepID=A0AAW2LGM1_9LAMI